MSVASNKSYAKHKDKYLAKQREYYWANRDKCREQSNNAVTARRKRNQEFILNYISHKSCVSCGNKDTRVLEFDHIDPSTKKANVGDLVSQGRSIKLLEAEITKCQLLCANCHRIKTWNERFPDGTYRQVM